MSGPFVCTSCREPVEATDLAADFDIVMGEKEWTVLDVCQRCFDTVSCAGCGCGGGTHAPWCPGGTPGEEG